MSTRTQIWIMGTTAIVTGVQAAIWLTRVPPLWPVIVLGTLAVLNAAGVVAAVGREAPRTCRRVEPLLPGMMPGLSRAPRPRSPIKITRGGRALSG